MKKIEKNYARWMKRFVFKKKIFKVSVSLSLKFFSLSLALVKYNSQILIIYGKKKKKYFSAHVHLW